MDTKVSNLITCHWIDHQWADIKRFYVKRENDRRGFIQLELTYKITAIRLKKYSDWILQLVNSHEKQKKKIFN